jgi:hypothetical protein
MIKTRKSMEIIHMKKIWIFVVLLSFLLGACSGGANTAATTESNTSASADSAAAAPAADGSQTQGAPGQGELPEIAKVLIGTFLLEDTDYAITAEQAASFLPLWKGLNALQSSDTVTNTELEGLYAQIVSTMTDDQMAQIESMNITFESMNTVMESLGLGGRGQGGPGGGMGDLTEEQIATMDAERAANGDQGFPGGGEGGGPGGNGGGDAAMMSGGPGGGAGGDAGMMAQGSSTDSSEFLPEQAGDPGLMMMTRLFEPLIELLQSKIN